MGPLATVNRLESTLGVLVVVSSLGSFSFMGGGLFFPLPGAGLVGTGLGFGSGSVGAVASGFEVSGFGGGVGELASFVCRSADGCGNLDSGWESFGGCCGRSGSGIFGGGLVLSGLDVAALLKSPGLRFLRGTRRTGLESMVETGLGIGVAMAFSEDKEKARKLSLLVVRCTGPAEQNESHEPINFKAGMETNTTKYNSV